MPFTRSAGFLAVVLLAFGCTGGSAKPPGSQGCDTLDAGDAYCASALDAGAGCVGICRNGHCEAYCADHCYQPTADAGACTPGANECQSQNGLASFPCSATAGCCIQCAFDSQCAEFGPGAVCERHCGSCCRPGDPSLSCECI